MVLKGCADRQQQDDGFLKQYRDAARSNFTEKFGGCSRLPEVLGDVSFVRVAEATQAGFPGGFPTSLSTLVVFLHWKDLFHKAGDQIDVDRLAEDVPEFLKAIGFEATVAAVWLLGCFAGYERVVPAVYAADAHAYPWYSGTPLRIEKISKPVTEQPVESELSVRGADAAKEEQGSEAVESTGSAEVGREDASELSIASTDSPEAVNPAEPNAEERPPESDPETPESSKKTETALPGTEIGEGDQAPLKAESESANSDEDSQAKKRHANKSAKTKRVDKSELGQTSELDLAAGKHDSSGADVLTSETGSAPETAEASKEPEQEDTKPGA